LRKIIRKASVEDISTWQEARKREDEVMYKSRGLAEGLGLVMKISDVEFQGDGAKATFYYTAEDRVDFRELIRSFAENFRVRIEMKQIGSRQEAQRLGGIGSCGRELCCSTWLTDFRSVSTSAARYQQLALNPQKLAGQCGKLKCCLNYELDSYMEAVKAFPGPNTKLHTEKGMAHLFKTDIFKRKLWFFYEDGVAGSNPVILDLESVDEILEMNKAGKKPKDLRDFEEVEEVVEQQFYANVVGQDSLTRFDESRKKKKRKNKSKGGNRPNKGDGKAKGPEAKKERPAQKKQDRPSGPKPRSEDSAKSQNPRPPRPKGNNNRRKNPGNRNKPEDS